MKRLILQSPESEKQKGFTPSWKMILPTDDPCQIYPCVSTPEQKKNVSALMQQDKSFALKCGWVDDGRIIMDTQDLGISGRLPMDKRPAFLGMLRRIEEGKIKAVIASQEDRLFRDKWGREYSKFMEICYIYGVLVITPDFVYDFSIDWHIDRFRRRCEEAWNYMQRHIYDRVIAAKHELARMGRWRGFAIATGYTVDLEEKRDGKKNPDYLKTIPYERHTEGIRWVYGLYKEKGGNMREVWNELMRHPIHFPPDEPNIPGAKQRKLKKVLDKDGNLIGYRIGSISGLRYILSNPIYAGYWVYQNVIISSENHTPIVDFGTFLYAFNRLSPVYLDGKPNEEYEMRRHKYAKRHDLERRTLLKNCIESGDEGYTINVKSDSTRPATTTGYAFYPKTSGPRGAEYSVNAKELDTIFIGKLIEKLQSANGYDDFLNEEEAEATARLQAIKDTELQIRTIKSLMKQIKEQIATGVLTNPRLLQKANESYNGYEQELNQYEMTLKELQGGTSQATQRRTYQQLTAVIRKVEPMS
ncbi:MAG: recombinase family protein [Ktedonobacteraceae bacterium]